MFTLEAEGSTAESIDLDSFIEANEFAPAEVDAIRALEVGEEMRFGGGAAVMFVLRRVA